MEDRGRSLGKQTLEIRAETDHTMSLKEVLVRGPQISMQGTNG